MGIRKSFSGAATGAALTSPLGISAMTVNCGLMTNLPNTVTGPFVVCVDRGGDLEEKILISSYSSGVSSTTLTVAAGGRGYDGTTAKNHSVGTGSQVVHTLDSDTIDAANLFESSVGSVPPGSSAVGDTPVEGVSTVAAAADHKHGREVFGVGVVAASAPGDVENDGVSSSLPRADHKHAREAFGASAGVSAVGDTQAPGTAASLAHSDHKHGREAFGTTATASAQGDTQAPGTATTPSRSDHKHGRETGITAYHSSGGLSGTSPGPTASGFLPQYGVTTATVSAGNWTFGLPAAFPNGITIAMFQCVDGTLAGNRWNVVANTHAINNAAINCQIFKNEAAFTGSVEVQYWLVGS